jgi:hypothetical protein
MRLSICLLIASLSLLVGCATGNGSFREDGFHHADYPYIIRYSSPATREFVSSEWRIDNYVLGDDGRPKSAKNVAPYYGTQSVDLDGDGKPEKDDVYFFDLKLDDKKTSATIWVQTIPLGPNEAERDLRVLMDEYVEGVSGTGFYAVGPIWPDDKREVRLKSYAAKVTESAPAKVSGLEAFQATIELANLDQMKLDPQSRSSIARVLLVRTGYMKAWDMPSKVVKVHTCMRIGYEARPQDFQAGIPDFEKFLELFDFRTQPQ